MHTDLPFLSLCIWLPILGGLWVIFAGSRVLDRPVKQDALIIALITFALSLMLYRGFDATTAAMQFTEKLAWIEAWKIYYHLGIDGIALPLILLTTFTTVLVVLAGWEVIEDRVNQYMGAFLILEGLMVGGLLRVGRDPLLCLVGSDADPDVSHHRHLGRSAPGLCHDQVLPVHLSWLGVHAGGAALSLRSDPQLCAPRHV